MSNVQESVSPQLWADNDIRTLETAIEMFKLNAKMLPPIREGLQSLVVRPADLGPDARWVQVLDKLPSDPWGNAYCYIIGDGFSSGFGIYSRGADGHSATQGNDADDISNWRENPPGTQNRFQTWIPWSMLACAFTAIIGFILGRRSGRMNPRSRTRIDEKAAGPGLARCGKIPLP